MGYIEREIARLEKMLRTPLADNLYCQMYAARQALVWALEPGGYKGPMETIQSGLVQPITGIPAGSTDYSAVPHQPPS